MPPTPDAPGGATPSGTGTNRAYDAIVIGSGQAGNPLAHRIADRGWRVALIEREHLGGSCINYGCTPTKAMLASAQVAYEARRGAVLGIGVGDVRVDLPAIVARKNQLVAQWRSGQERHAASRPGITLIRGAARLTGADSVVVNGATLRATHIFVNVGTSPRIPDIPGLGGVPHLTNRTILDLTELPRHLVVLGGGYVGLEFGQMFRRFGSRVSIIQRSAQIVPREDDDVSRELRAALEAEGIEILTATEAKRVERTPTGVRIATRSAEGAARDIDASHLLVSVGRSPNTADLGLDAAGVAAERGWICVNERLETNVPGIYALGDVTGGPAFTHISYNDFQIVLHNLLYDDKHTTAGRIVPYALFTDPELGRVGMTEREARASGRPVLVGSIPMGRVARAIERGDTRGLMKVVVDAETEQVLGAAILGHGGGDIVQTLMALMMTGASWKTFHQAVFIHPTMTEGFFALMNSVKPL